MLGNTLGGALKWGFLHKILLFPIAWGCGYKVLVQNGIDLFQGYLQFLGNLNFQSRLKMGEQPFKTKKSAVTFYE